MKKHYKKDHSQIQQEDMNKFIQAIARKVKKYRGSTLDDSTKNIDGEYSVVYKGKSGSGKGWFLEEQVVSDIERDYGINISKSSFEELENFLRHFMFEHSEVLCGTKGTVTPYDYISGSFSNVEELREFAYKVAEDVFEKTRIRNLIEVADSGDVKAMEQLGEYYRDIQECYITAMHWFYLAGNLDELDNVSKISGIELPEPISLLQYARKGEITKEDMEWAVNSVVAKNKKIMGSARFEDYINKDNSAAQKAYECSCSWSPSSGKRPASIYDYKEIKIK